MFTLIAHLNRKLHLYYKAFTAVQVSAKHLREWIPEHRVGETAKVKAKEAEVEAPMS